MKAYKVEILIIDFDQLGGEQIKEEMENVRYPNRCISPRVMDVREADIGEWDDEHPLNHYDEMGREFARLFPPVDP